MAAISAKDRQTLELVSDAIFVNPFSDARAHTNAALVQTDVASVRADPSYMERTLERIDTCIGNIGGANLLLPNFAPEDAQLVERALLFSYFHRAWDDFADLEARGHGSKRPVIAPFVEPLLQRLTRHGISRARARRYVALFWQIWRAYLYIDRGLVGTSASMVALREHLWNQVFTHDLAQYDRFLAMRMEDFSTLLLGETGTGKGAAAAAIGRSGFIPLAERDLHFVAEPTDTFLAINLSEYSPSIIESELFGHRKGAFTGAVEGHEGLLARCSSYGSVFLDEIGELDMSLQTKLLRVLQDRSFTPVGSHEPHKFAGRVIAATNRDLDDMRAEGAFRDDLYYRLCGDEIELPSLRRRLRERPEELDELVGALLDRMVGDDAGDDAGELQARVVATLEQDLPGKARGYGWRGNVRELEQAIRRVLLTGHYMPRATALPGDDKALEARLKRGIDEGTISASALVGDYCRLLHARHGTYEEVGRRAGLDRRTVKKYITSD